MDYKENEQLRRHVKEIFEFHFFPLTKLQDSTATLILTESKNTYCMFLKSQILLLLREQRQRCLAVDSPFRMLSEALFIFLSQLWSNRVAASVQVDQLHAKVSSGCQAHYRRTTRVQFSSNYACFTRNNEPPDHCE